MNKKSSWAVFGVLTSALLLIPFFVTHASNVESDIITDTTWSIDQSPYIVKSPVVIASNAILSIDPGVIVKFDSSGSLIVDGVLQTSGTETQPIYLTSLKDDFIGGDSNEDGAESLPEKSDWDGIIFNNLNSPSVLLNTYIKYSYNGLATFNSSISLTNVTLDTSINGIRLFDGSLVVNNLTVLNIDQYGLALYGNSTVTGKDITMRSILNGDAILAFETSQATIQNLVLNDISSSEFSSRAPVELYDQSILNLSDSLIKNSNYTHGVFLFGASLNATHTIFTVGNGDGISVYDGGKLKLTESEISRFADTGLSDYSADANQDILNIKKSKIQLNDIGINFYGSNTLYNLSGNTIDHNTHFGTESFAPGTISLKNNYWGDPSGPKHSISNPNGLGDEIFDIPDYNEVSFNPWLRSWPSEPQGISSVIFLPGFQASRLYKEKSILGIPIEDQLWEPNNNSDVKDLSFTSNGQSVNSKIYTKDVIAKTNVPFGIPFEDIYEPFFSSLTDLVESSEMSDWSAVPYDWRFSVDDIVNKGVKKSDGSISYIDQIPAGQLPYIIEELKSLIQNSRTGKVTIVTHSNGGLLVKTLVKKLSEMKTQGQLNLIDSIDNVIMVAPPSLGTPQAIASLLHGEDAGIGIKSFNFILGRNTARTFGENIPGAYGLLPSNQYFSLIENKPILFDPIIDKVNNFRQKYGESIDSYEELKQFLTASKDHRQKPDEDDLLSPSVLNGGLIDKEQNLHNSIDNFNFPANISVYQIAGWGLPTIKDINYKAKEECLVVSLNGCAATGYELDPNIETTSDGDKTVVSPSATFGNSIDYYFNLKDWNIDHPDIDHKNIFKAEPIINLINNITHSSSTLPSYISTIKPQASDNLVLSMHSPMTLDLYDENGDHTGVVQTEDPNVSYVEENIVNSSYFQMGDKKYIVVPKEGNYTVRMSGLDFGTFTLNKDTLIADKKTETISFVDIPATPTMQAEISLNNDGYVSDMSIDADGDGNYESNIAPQTEFDPIVYLEMMKQTIISFNLSDKVEKDLIKRIDNLEKLIQKGKIKNVQKRIKIFTKKLKLKRGHIGIKKMTKEERDQLIAILNDLLDNIK